MKYNIPMYVLLCFNLTEWKQLWSKTDKHLLWNNDGKSRGQWNSKIIDPYTLKHIIKTLVNEIRNCFFVYHDKTRNRKYNVELEFLENTILLWAS